MVQRVKDYIHSTMKQTWNKRRDSRENDFRFANLVKQNQTSHIDFALYPSDDEEHPFLKNVDPIKQIKLCKKKAEKTVEKNKLLKKKGMQGFNPYVGAGIMGLKDKKNNSGHLACV